MGESSFNFQFGIAHFNDFAPGKSGQIQQFGGTLYEFRRLSPQFQARGAFTWDKENNGYFAVGLSSGPLNTEFGGKRERVTHWWFASELRIPVGPVTLSGEFWMGEGVGYGAGIGQAVVLVNADRAVAVPAMGGWMQLTIQPTKAVRFNALWGVDDAANEVGDIPIDKERNVTYLGNVIWDVLPYWTVALECQYVSTKYGDGKSPNNTRFLFGTLLKF
jgi:hypothetical protein